jgi:molybdopterin-guanine dinucleotide biosynthesis protein A
MGTDKALLPLPGSSQVSFLQHLTQVMLGECGELVLVTRDRLQADVYARYVSSSVRIVVDEVPDCGPLMGICSGLRVVEAACAFVCAVDTPLLQASLLRFLLAQTGQAQGTVPTEDVGRQAQGTFPTGECCDDTLVIPVVGGLPQVLLAVYPRALLSLVEERLRAGRRDPRSLLEVAAVRYIPEERLRLVDPHLRSFLNVNTPEDLNTLRLLLETDK